jgi:hypothetical protein
MKSVYSAVRTGHLIKAVCTSCLKCKELPLPGLDSAPAVCIDVLHLLTSCMLRRVCYVLVVSYASSLVEHSSNALLISVLHIMRSGSSL